MTDSSPQELVLTTDLIGYAQSVALAEARKHLPRARHDDAVQDAVLQLVSKPPKFDPTRGASPKTLIYTIVQRAVLKFAEREWRHGGRNEQLDEPDQVPEAGAKAKSLALDDILQFIDNKDSRALCRLVIECEGNISDAARRLGLSEGTVRYRLKLLGPKLQAAGFDPFGD